MANGYNFQQLQTEILALSRAKDWETARKEWKLIWISEADEPESCPCGHFPIIELCTISNATTGNTIEVGNVCVKRFLGFRSDLIFASVKRIRNNGSKSIGADAAVFFHERGILNSWEYGFIQSTYRKRNLSNRQMATRRTLNTKILDSLQRRGIN